MEQNYHVRDGRAKGAGKTLAAFCRAKGQILLPLVEWIEPARLAVDTGIEQMSQQTLEMLLRLSSDQIAGPQTPGKARGKFAGRAARSGG